MKFMRIVPLLAAVLITVPALAGPAQGKQGGPHKGKFWAELNLSEEQKSKLKELRIEGREARQNHFTKVKLVRDKIKEELLKSSPSQSILNTYADELATLHKEMSAQHVSHLLKVKGILTPEQFKKLVESDAFRPARGEGPCESKKLSGGRCKAECPKAGQQQCKSSAKSVQ